MRTVFADSFYFFALGNRHDPAHGKAVTFSQTFNGRLVTTGFVLVEVVDGCASSTQRRAVAVEAVNELRNNPDVTIILGRAQFGVLTKSDCGQNWWNCFGVCVSFGVCVGEASRRMAHG